MTRAGMPGTALAASTRKTLLRIIATLPAISKQSCVPHPLKMEQVQ